MRLRPCFPPRAWIAISALTWTGVACHSATAPAPGQVWNYQASALTDATAGVTCSFSAPMSVTQTSGPFTGTFTNGYLACSSPAGASSTLVSGTIESGTVSGSAIAFAFVSNDVTNSGEIASTPQGFHNTGTIIANDTQMTGTATLTVTVAGQAYVVTGTWQANIE